jgi:hypothetical protein
MSKAVFVSVGSTSTKSQEDFVRAVEDRLRIEGLEPHTVGRNTFGSEAPLKTVTQLMDKCAGAVVIALERTYFAEGIDKRGGGETRERILKDVRLPTTWNHIGAALSYAQGLPLLVIVEEGLKEEGLLERGYDWYVQRVKCEPTALHSLEFNGVLFSWKEKLGQAASKNDETKRRSLTVAPTDLTVAELLGGLKPSQLWAVLGAIAILIGGAFAVGAKLVGN